MSADNGIYILKTKDQYRVAHLCAIDNIYYSIIDKNWCYNNETKNKYVPTRIVEMFHDSRYTKDESKALELAHKWASSLPICEYGVNTITYNKTWKHILMDAKDYAEKEINFIKENNLEEKWEYDLPKLQKIANGYYLNEWLNKIKSHKENNNVKVSKSEYNCLKTMTNDLMSFEYFINNLGIETRTDKIGDEFRNAIDIIKDIVTVYNNNPTILKDCEEFLSKNPSTSDECDKFLSKYNLNGIYKIQ